MLKKPKIGEVCNGCGLCCMAITCGFGSAVMGAPYGQRISGSCEALIEQQDGSFSCEIIKNPEFYSDQFDAEGKALNENINQKKLKNDLRKAAILMTGAGLGCDDIGEGEEKAFEKIMLPKFKKALNPKALKKARKLWNI